MKEELEGMRGRMEQHAEEMSSKMAAEREIVRQENKQERDDLNNKVCTNCLQTFLSSMKQNLYPNFSNEKCFCWHFFAGWTSTMSHYAHVWGPFG